MAAPSTNMDRLERFISWPVAKPYRTRKLDGTQAPFLNDDGQVDFAPDDLENPKTWSARRRWYITIVSVLLVVNATFASTGPSGSLIGISEYFNVSEEAAGLVITLFLLGYCAGPLFFAPLSEFYGRRYIFYITFTCYLAFTFLCAWAPNFAALLVGRFLCGTFASAPLSNAPGVLADLWQPIDRGNAMALFSVMTFAGPSLGPVISGFLQVTEDWQWTFYVLLFLGGFTELAMFTIPETYAPVILITRAKRIRKSGLSGYENVQAPAEVAGRSLATMFRIALTRPWLILWDPIALLVAIYMTVVYTLLYMLFTIYPIVFQEKRGWNAGVGELPFIGSIVGAFLGGFTILMVSRRDKKKELAGYQRKAEDRLPLAMVGGIMFAITMFWFAWTAEFNSVPWIVPTIAGSLLSMAILLIFVSYLNYLTDTYLMYTASAMAGNTVCRSASAAVSELYTNYMFEALGVGGGGSLIGGCAVLLAPIPFLFYRYGPAIREKSRFAPTPAKLARQKSEEEAAISRTNSQRERGTADTDIEKIGESQGNPSKDDSLEESSIRSKEEIAEEEKVIES